MESGIPALASAFGIGTAFGSVVTLMLKHRLGLLVERRRQQIATDRATYQERSTRLIAANLCAYIRSNRCRDGEQEALAEIIQELSDGSHQTRFLDPKVQERWRRLVDKSAECGYRRLAGVLTEQEIADYVQVWEAWLLASRDSFGPLPENDRPRLRRASEADSVERAA